MWIPQWQLMHDSRAEAGFWISSLLESARRSDLQTEFNNMVKFKKKSRKIPSETETDRHRQAERVGRDKTRERQTERKT